MEKILSRFSDVVWVLQQVLFMSFDKRLAMFLVEEVEKTDGNEIYLTHEQMAQNLGTVREAVSYTHLDVYKRQADMVSIV